MSDQTIEIDADELAWLKDMAVCAESGRQTIEDCPGGRPIVSGLVCIHCDADPGDGKCGDPRPACPAQEPATLSRTFPGGPDFAGLRAAQIWCADNGFATDAHVHGGGSPTLAVIRGSALSRKSWADLSATERAGLDGQIRPLGDYFETGGAMLILKAEAVPEGEREHFEAYSSGFDTSSEVEEQEAPQHVPQMKAGRESTGKEPCAAYSAKMADQDAEDLLDGADLQSRRFQLLWNKIAKLEDDRDQNLSFTKGGLHALGQARKKHDGRIEKLEARLEGGGRKEKGGETPQALGRKAHAINEVFDELVAYVEVRVGGEAAEAVGKLLGTGRRAILGLL